MKILVIRFSSIGDIAQTQPVVRCIRKRYPDAEIHFLTKKQYASIVQHNPQVNKLILLEESLLDVIKQLKQEHYDVIIDLHHNLRTFIIKAALGVKAYAFPKLNIEKWLLTNLKINRLPKGVHLVDRYFEPCKHIDVYNDGLGLEYFFAEQDKVDLNTALPDGFENGYIAWIIGAKFATKILPQEKVIAAIKLLHQQNSVIKVVILGGKEDAVRGEAIAQACGNNVFNACGKFTLNQSVYLVANAQVIAGNDTGLTQIAPAFHKKLVSIWGSTSTVFGVEPYCANEKGLSSVVEVKGLSCRPCTKFGRNECPKGHFDCMRKIDEQKIVRELLNPTD